MLDHNLVLKSDELYLVGESNTDGSGEPATGLYLRDTRHLSRFRLSLNGTPLDRLSARVVGPATATVVEANGPIPLPRGEIIQPHTIAVEQRVELGAAVEVGLRVRNFWGRRALLTLAIRLAADFRDLFDVRGFPREGRRGTFARPETSETRVVLGYVARDGVTAATRIAFDRPASVAVLVPGGDGEDVEEAVLLPGFDQLTERSRPPIPPSAVASFEVELEPGEEWRLGVTVTPEPADGVPVSAAALSDGAAPAPVRVTTDNSFFDRFLDRCRSDLLMLQTSFPAGSLPAAGIPWYVAPFGRDSLIVGLQTFHSAPGRAATTLRALAALQGTIEDPERDEEPGKILHEARYGEMARLGEILHTPYYGTVDATPLFVWLFAETVAWTGDERLYRDLLPNVRRAIEWIECYGDADGDGFVEYWSRTEPGGHIIHQGWKDSHDSLHHPDGRPASGRIALVEVQGYVFAAYRRLAEVVAAWGEAAWAGELAARAEAMRRRVEDRFWLEEEGCYAQALDGDKEPVRAVSSNAGHLLFCGLPSRERAARLAGRLREPDLASSWGVRTLSAATATYNPMSYHNGSVWPHDNSLMAAGLRVYGEDEGAHAIATALVEAAQSDPLSRLPELYCGFARLDGAADAPVPYPVSCSPQAWAAGVGPLLVRTLLGLRVDVAAGELVVEPALPGWLNRMTIEGVKIFGRPLAIEVRKRPGGYDVATEGSVRVAGDVAARVGDGRG